MLTIRSLMLLTGLLLLALPAFAVDTYQFTINSNSPHTIETGLIIQQGDRILIQAEGAMRYSTGRPVMDGWFDPSGLGRLNRAGQILGDSSYGTLIGSYYSTLNNGFVIGDLASFNVQGSSIGTELLLGVNMSSSDLSSAEGAFKVHVTRFQDSEVDQVTLTIDADTIQPVATGIIAHQGDQFLVLGQGAAKVIGSRPVTGGWFDASGLGVLSRAGQIFPLTAYGSLLGTFNNVLGAGFSIGDATSWDTQPADWNDELKLGLNMSDSDLALMEGSIVAHVLRIGSGAMSSVDGAAVPGAIVSLGNYPNPFNPMTKVHFELNRPTNVRVSIVNVAGELVQTLANRTYPAGSHHMNWDGRDASGKGQASGTYFLRLETNETVQNHKLTLVR